MVPELDVAARMPTLLTTALTAALEPETTTRAFCPAFTFAIWASGTDTTTVLAPLPTRVTAVVLVDAEAPTLAPTATTRPLIGARSTVLSRATCADTTEASAWSTWAWLEASRLAESDELDAELDPEPDRFELEVLGVVDAFCALDCDSSRARPFSAICSACCAEDTAACACERAASTALHCWS